MAKAIGMDSDDKRWEEEEDAQALIRYLAMKKDTKRLNAALKRSKTMAKERIPNIKRNIERQKDEMAGLKTLSTRKAKAFN